MAETWQIPQSYFDAIKKAESGGRPYVKAPTSSASGLYQFIKSTWISLGGKWGSDSSQAFGGLKPPVSEQEEMIRKFTGQNADYLDRKGITVTPGNLYAAHFLGAGTAANILRASPGTPVSGIVSESVISANQFLAKFSVADFINWAAKKGGGSDVVTKGGSGSSGSTFSCPHCGGRIAVFTGAP